MLMFMLVLMFALLWCTSGVGCAAAPNRGTAFGYFPGL